MIIIELVLEMWSDMKRFDELMMMFLQGLNKFWIFNRYMTNIYFKQPMYNFVNTSKIFTCSCSPYNGTKEECKG